MSADNKQKAQDYLAAIIKRDRATLDALITDDVQVWVPQSILTFRPMTIPVVGRENVWAFFTGTNAYDHSFSKFKTLHALGDGDLVSIHWNLQSRTRAGADYNNEYIFLFRFEAERIAEVWEFTDTAYAFAKFAEKSK